MPHPSSPAPPCARSRAAPVWSWLAPVCCVPPQRRPARTHVAQDRASRPPGYCRNHRRGVIGTSTWSGVVGTSTCRRPTTRETPPARIRAFVRSRGRAVARSRGRARAAPHRVTVEGVAAAAGLLRLRLGVRLVLEHEHEVGPQLELARVGQLLPRPRRRGGLVRAARADERRELELRPPQRHRGSARTRSSSLHRRPSGAVMSCFTTVSSIVTFTTTG